MSSGADVVCSAWHSKEVKMRCISLLIVGALLASCTASAQEPGPSARAQARYQQLLAGRVPQAPMTCLPTRQANDMIVIDDNTIVFNDGARVYVNHPRGGCAQLSQGHTALLTHEYGEPGPCRGDVAQLEDTCSHTPVGSCIWGDFIPYVRQGR
jgi:hypothetical protein